MFGAKTAVKAGNVARRRGRKERERAKENPIRQGGEMEEKNLY